VQETHVKERRVTGVTLSTGETKRCDRLIWSAPVIFLVRSAGLVEPLLERPSLSKTVLVDMVLDQPLQFEGLYLTCFDENTSMFRITNYTELQGTGDASGLYRTTIEIIIPPNGSDSCISAENLFVEMKAMEIIATKTRLVKSWVNEIAQGFPIPTLAFQKNSSTLAAYINDSVENAILLGRSSGRAFFMKDVLVDTFEQLNV
jgi:hypothetical protein